MFDTLLENGSYHRTFAFLGLSTRQLAGRTTNQTTLQSGDRVIALVNNLGATPLSELYGVYNRLTTLPASGIDYRT